MNNDAYQRYQLFAVSILYFSLKRLKQLYALIFDYRNNRSSSGVSSGSCSGDYIPQKDDSLKDISYNLGSYLAIKRNRRKSKSIKSNVKSKISNELTSKEAKLNLSTGFNGASEEDSAFCPEISLQRNPDSNDNTGEKV